MALVDENNVGEGIHAGNAAWSFGGKTVDVFAEHVRRSVPMYENGHDLICQLSDFFVQRDSTVYELGTSVGDLILRLASRHKVKDCKFVGIDIQPEMVEKAKEATREERNVSIELDDLVTCSLESADLIVSYYCIQFVSPRHRQVVLDKIYSSLNWGGAFIWFEKVRGPDARFQDIASSLYVDYKLDQKYTPEEIVAKTRSLKGILEPFSTQGNLDMLSRAGFSDVMTIFKYICFEGFLAIK